MDALPLVATFTLGAGAGAAAAALLLLRARSGRERQTRLEARDAARDHAAELRSMTGGLAHEIKNPLSTLVLNAQLMREDILDMELDEETRGRVVRRVDALARESARLREILEDFLKFAGRVQLDRQPRDLRELLDELCDFFRPQAEQAGVLLRVDLPERPVVAPVDAGLLKQALLNLLLNAVQAMESSSARRELLMRLESDPPALKASELPEARIHVIDTGPGIPPERRETLFRPYASTKPGGTGLGLATARRIAEEHGGRIMLFTEPGVGTDFVVHLPLNPASPGGAAAPERTSR